MVNKDEALYLAGGWYRFEALNSNAVLVFTLSGIDNPVFAEITSSEKAPCYTKLLSGHYRFTVQSNQNNPQFKMGRLGPLELMTFFFGQLLRKIRQGASFRALTLSIVRALNSRRWHSHLSFVQENFFAKHSLGPLAQARLNNFKNATPTILSIESGPRIFVSIISPGDAASCSLKQQTYTNFTTIPLEKAGCEFVLEIPGDAILAPDALQQLVAPLEKQPDLLAVFADVFMDGLPTFCFGFDPIRDETLDDLSNLVLSSVQLYDSGGLLTGVASENIFRVATPLAIFPKTYSSFTLSEKAVADRDHNIACIIPTRDRADLLQGIIFDLLDNSRGIGEIVIVDNGSVQAETHLLFEELTHRGVRIVRDDGPFNFSRLCNAGAAAAQSEVLAFINNDVRVRKPDWLIHLAKWTAHPNVGAVGTRLLYGDESLQHAGICLSLSGVAGHLFRGWPREAWETVPSITKAGRRSAVTGAVLVVDARKFFSVGGFDEKTFPVTLNDVDLCLRLTAAGYHCVYEPLGEAYHLESQSRSSDETAHNYKRRADEVVAFRLKWQTYIEREPWFSPQLSRLCEELRLL